jgi:hypothetical protein
MHFCNAYKNNYKWFSVKGKRWIDSTRKCLHQQLVPFLNRDDGSQKTTCKEIQETAFESHNCCYTAGTKCTKEERPSICDIPCEDWFFVFWTIKEAFVGDTVQESISGLWYTAKTCTLDVDSVVTQDCFNKFGRGKHPWLRAARLTVIITTFLLNSRKQRSIPYGGITDKDRVAFKIMSSVSKQLGWDHEKLDWFVYTDGENLLSSKKDQQIYINCMIADKQARNSRNTTHSNLLNTTISEMVDRMEQGTIKFDADFDDNYNVQLKTFEECLTTNCKNITIRVEIPNQSDRIDSLGLQTTLLLSLGVNLITYLLRF